MWTCIWIERNGLATRHLVSTSSEKCPLGDFKHTASVPIENGPLVVNEGKDTLGSYPLIIPFIDEHNRWATHCACGYQFTENDPRMCRQNALYVSADMTIRTILKDAPAGAMWDSPWLSFWTNPEDGRCVTVRLPDGNTWHVDGPDSYDRKTWTRTGTVPHITVRPSILTPFYHGWLMDGVLSDDLEGRRY